MKLHFKKIVYHPETKRFIAVMFSGAKHKIQQWKKKKISSKRMASLRQDHKSLHDIRGEVIDTMTEITTFQLKSLLEDTDPVIKKLNQQVQDLLAIDEDPGPVIAKIDFIEENRVNILKGIESNEEKNSVRELFDASVELEDAIKYDIFKLKKEVTGMEQENRRLRTELLIYRDHLERTEVKKAELEVQVEHQKFINSLPTETEPFLQTEEEEKNEETEFDAKEVINFIEEHLPLESTSTYILNQLNTVDFTLDSRLKILFDLITSYLQEGAYDIVVFLLKSTIEDLAVNENPHQKNIFTMTEVMAQVLNMTERFKECLDVYTEILQTRREMMPNDKIGLAETLSKLAILNSKTGKVKAARVFSREALDIKHSVFGENGVETAIELHNLGVLYCYDKQFQRGIKCMLSAFLTFRSSSNRNIFFLGTVAANVAAAHFLNGEHPEGRKACNSALKFLYKELAKLLAGKGVTVDEVLHHDAEYNNILEDYDDKENIIKLISFIDQVKMNLTAVSHISLKVKTEEEEIYSPLNLSTSEDE